MSNQPDNIGVKALWDNSDFAKGNQGYLMGLLKSNKATSKATGLLSKFGSTAGIAVTVGVTAAIAAIALLAAGFVALIAGGVKVVKTLAQIAVESAPLAGIGMAFENMAGKFNVSLDAMRAASGGTISDFELMRQANVALTGAGDEFGAQFGKALPTLLAGARKASQATGQSVDFLFNSLIGGLKRSSPLLIDNTGYVVSVTEAQKNLADELGITTSQLTEEQKQIALLNATTSAINATIDEFGVAQLTAADHMSRITSETSNIKDMLGISLQPALETVTGAWADMLAGMSANIREGGALQSVFVKIGAVASIMADGIAAGIDMIGDAINWIANAFDSGLSDVIQNAFDWGVGIVESLAEGMVQAIGSVLTWAMNAITSALTSWLAPGSPPKVAPDLDKWGMSAIGEWLKGFTDADFSVLDEIQRPLKDAFQYLEKTGGIGEGKAGEMFANISKQLIEGIATGDTSGALDAIRKQAGEFGNEIADLALAQLELADATNSVTESEKRLEEARKGASSATEESMKQASEYNRLLREGASDEILAGQLAQVDAAETAEAAALNEISAAEDALKVAKEREEQAKKSAESQKNALDEMMDLQDELTKDAPKEAGGGTTPGGGGGAGDLGGGGGLGGALGGAMDGITTMLTEKVAEMKQNIIDTLSGVWDQIKLKWDTVTGPMFTAIQTAWDNMTLALKTAYDEKIVPMWTGFEEWVNVHIITAINDLKADMILLRDYIVTSFTLAWTELGTALSGVNDWFVLHVNPAIVAAQEVIAALNEYIVTNFQTALGNLELVLGKIKVWLVDEITPGVSIMQEAFTDLTDYMVGNFQVAMDVLELSLSKIHNWLNDIWLVIKDELIDVMQSWYDDALLQLADGLESIEGFLAKAVSWLKKLPDLINAIPSLPDWTENSPAPLAVGISSVSDAIKDVTKQLPIMSAQVAGLNMQTRGIAPASTTHNSNVANINMQNTFAGGLGLAQVAQVVRDVIRMEMRP